MGTSNWQHIPYCIDALMRIAPESVLDIGVGFGRWGMIIREFCDVWSGRVLRKDWNVHVEGVEAFPESIDEYHYYFYNKIHLGDFKELLSELTRPWSVVNFGDVLEHFDKGTAHELLQWSLTHGQYVIVNIPLGTDWEQEDMYENSYERHLSEWHPQDFDQYFLRRRAFFFDFLDRPSGTFILSKDDPKDVTSQLFSRATAHDCPTVDLSNERDDFSSIINAALLPEEEKNILKSVARLTGDLRLAQVELSHLRNKCDGLTRENNGLKLCSIAASKTAVSMERTASLVTIMSECDGPCESKEALSTDCSATRFNRWSFAEDDLKFIEKTLKNPRPISVNHPAWRGILSASREMFDTIFLLDDQLTEESGLYYARLFTETECPALVLQGFPLSYIHLVNGISRLAPQLPIYVIWHGSFMQVNEDMARDGMNVIKQLCLAGKVKKWGFVKSGMAEVARSLGIDAGFIMNWVNAIPEGPSKVSELEAHIGIWGSAWNWRKSPYAMLAAASQLEGAVAHMADFDEISKYFCDFLELKVVAREGLFPQKDMLDQLSRMHLNMYVTFSECAPMLPLESLAAGTPCIFGANSHFFEDDEYLYSRLVVPRPDDNDVIAKYAKCALEERNEIIEQYITFAPEYNKRARQSLADFLEVQVQGDKA